MRMLYGSSKEAAERRDRVFRRAARVDEYLASYRFHHCDYCQRGWFGTTEQAPDGVSTNHPQQQYMNFLLAEQNVSDPRRPICQDCAKDRRRLTAENHMTFGPTHKVLDDLTYFEEQLLSPIQPVVRIYTLYGTGLTEARGHVANWVQNGPEYVRAIPLKAGDAQILLVRRFPKDPNRKQRVPFVVSRRRLERALNQLVKPEQQGGHQAFQDDRLVRNGRVPVHEANLEEYADTEEGAEPEGLQVLTVDQGERFLHRLSSSSPSSIFIDFH